MQKLRELDSIHREQHLQLVQQIQQLTDEIFGSFLAELKGLITRYAPALEYLRSSQVYVGYQARVENVATELLLELIKRGYWFDPKNFVIMLCNAIRRELQSTDDEYLESLLRKLESVPSMSQSQYEEVAMRCLAELKSRLSEAEKVALQHRSEVEPSVFNLALEVIDKAVDELRQKTGKTEELIMWDLKREFNIIRKVAESLLITVTILLPSPGEKHAD